MPAGSGRPLEHGIIPARPPDLAFERATIFRRRRRGQPTTRLAQRTTAPGLRVEPQILGHLMEALAFHQYLQMR
jgi:hypothetical protein